MAKAGFWLKGATGKLAGSALQKGANGETIIREIVTPKNPQTRGQLVQRVIMQTIAQAYSQMKTICNHSYEGITQGALSQQRFNTLNLNWLRQHVAREVDRGLGAADIYAFSTLGRKSFVPNSYIISEGSLPGVVVGVTGGYCNAVSVDATSYRTVINSLGLRRGDQLTFIGITRNPLELVAPTQFHYARVILDPMDANGDPMSLDTAFIQGGFIASGNRRNEGTSKLYLNKQTQPSVALQFGFDLETGGRGANFNIAACVVVSRKDGSNWLRSNAQMVVDNTALVNYASLETAIQAAGQGDFTTENSLYLNNAGNEPYLSDVEGTTAYIFTKTDSTWTQGAEKTIVGLTNADGVKVAVDSDGTEYPIANLDPQSVDYGKAINADGTSLSRIATEATTVVAYAATNMLDENFIAWLEAKGVSSSLFSEYGV